MIYSALKLAEYLDGKLEGDPNISVTNIAKIQEANNDSVTFLSNKKYAQFVHSTKASIIVSFKIFTPECTIELLPMITFSPTKTFS